MSKKVLISLAVLILVIAAAAALLLWQPWKPAVDNSQFNTAATNLALQQSVISTNEVLLLESTGRDESGNLTATFRVYIVAEGYSASQFIGLSVAEAAVNKGLSDVGHATASFLKDKPTGIFGLKVYHER